MRVASEKTKSAPPAVNEMVNRFAGGVSKECVADIAQTRKRYA
jgi:hypothetical protein